MSDRYLWDRSGEPDPEVERLERVLGALQHDRPAPDFKAPPVPAFLPWYAWPGARRAMAAAAVLLIVATAAGLMWGRRGARASWEIATLEGAPRVGAAPVRGGARLGVGEWLETDAGSRAQLRLGDFGEVEVQPNSRVRLVRSRASEQRLWLRRGTLDVVIWAPPRRFFVDTPSATAVDLGCAYTLDVDERGVGLVRVTSGWVGFALEGHESFIPAGALCETRPGVGPGTPYFEDASASFSSALRALDFDAGTAARREAALDTVLAEARERDGVTLWHLLARLERVPRARVYERLLELVPPPASVTREGVLSGNRVMLDRWWNALGLGDTGLWRTFEGRWPKLPK